MREAAFLTAILLVGASFESAVPDVPLQRECLAKMGYHLEPKSYAVSVLDGRTRFGLCLANDRYTGSETWWRRPSSKNWIALGHGLVGPGAGKAIEARFGVPSADAEILVRALAKLKKSQKSSETSP